VSLPTGLQPENTANRFNAVFFGRSLRAGLSAPNLFWPAAQKRISAAIPNAGAPEKCAVVQQCLAEKLR